MRTFLLFCMSAFLVVGCARVQMEAPKEPIKLDISMRLDVYQHVERDIDEIENIVSGAAQEPQSKAIDNLFNFLVTDAYALEGLSPEVEQAALRRRDRRPQLEIWLSKGVLGENRSGLIEIRNSGDADAQVQALVQAENADRMIIYQGVAQKNGTSVDDVQKLYAKHLQEDAASGTPIETADSAGGSYSWKTK